MCGGYTDNYLPVYLGREKCVENNMTRVKIMGVDGEMLIGEPV